VKVVLECDYHLSYPFLLEWQGDVYMIPETRGNRTIEMYKAKNFPYSWEHAAVLIPNVTAADSTLLQYEGKWWLFAAGATDKSSPDHELFLYCADSPLGPWRAHPKNPIVSDPRHARPAGKLYVKDGKLIRPGQDSSANYGGAIQLHQVNVISETEYQETTLARITPAWLPGALGTHTLNQSSKFQVIDARFMVPRFSLGPLSPRRRSVVRLDQAGTEAASLVCEPGRNSK
jgi:hypothetical protein